MRRRTFLQRVALAAAASGVATRGSSQPRPFRVLLNSNFSGPQAFFFLAQDRGYFKDAGLDVTFVAGDGAAAVVPRIGTERFDFGYGDLNALVPLVARGVTDAPIAVYVTFNTTPLTIAVDAAGPIHTPQDLEGRIVAGHPIDAALEVFPEFAAATGIDARTVTVQRSSASMRSLVEDMLAGRSAGVFGFVNTIIASVAPAGIDGRTRLRFLEYRDHTPDLYGNALMVSRRLLQARPDDVRAFVRAVNRGLRDTVADLDAAIASVVARDNTVRADVDRPRLAGTLAMEMAHPEGARLGIGDVDDGRLSRGIALIAKSRGLTRVPAPTEIFSRACLPPQDERITSLARDARARASTPLRMLLNSGYSSVNAWFCLADDRGYLREAGVTVTFTDGVGAYTAAGRTAAEAFDIGYGDVNALVEELAKSNAQAPVAVYMMFNRSPSVIAVARESAIRVPRDFVGKHFRGHATDVALQTFPMLAAQHGLDASTVRISTSEDGMGAVVQSMLAGDVDGVFGYETTITAALVTAKISPERVRFFFYRDLTPDLYGSALMVSRRLVREQPALVQGLVRAVNRGVRDTIADPGAAIAAVRRRAPAIVEAAERARLALTLKGEMAHPEGVRLGIGAIDPARFGAGIAALCSAKRLARTPAVAEVFDASFAVPPAERIYL